MYIFMVKLPAHNTILYNTLADIYTSVNEQMVIGTYVFTIWLSVN